MLEPWTSFEDSRCDAIWNYANDTKKNLCSTPKINLIMHSRPNLPFNVPLTGFVLSFICSTSPPSVECFRVFLLSPSPEWQHNWIRLNSNPLNSTHENGKVIREPPVITLSYRSQLHGVCTQHSKKRLKLFPGSTSHGERPDKKPFLSCNMEIILALPSRPSLLA